MHRLGKLRLQGYESCHQEAFSIVHKHLCIWVLPWVCQVPLKLQTRPASGKVFVGGQGGASRSRFAKCSHTAVSALPWPFSGGPGWHLEADVGFGRLDLGV